ncbi:oxidoreductase [Streptomyces sp. NPDC048277]|uniref:oxidoreductase n=1 Tax=Streptomyces sp. NPDC048277 TaxID=3155027 RepID=UPI00340B2851
MVVELADRRTGDWTVVTDGDLGAAEQRVWDAALTGEFVDLRGGDPERDDLAGGAGWGPERTVRAEVVVSALLRSGSSGGPAGALHLAGARVTGRLDLGGATVERELRLEDCWFDEQVVLRSATLRSTGFLGCRIPGLEGRLLKVDGNLRFDRSVIDGRITLTRGHITGELHLNGARLTATELLDGVAPDPDRAPSVWAMWAGGLLLDGGCFASHGFSARGGLRFVGVSFSGGLFMRAARIDNPGGDALTGDDLSASALVLADGFRAVGAVRLPGATIRSRLSLDGAVLQGGAVALDGRRMSCGELQLTFAATPEGVVDLQDAQTAVLHDSEHSWPADTRLDGFTYNSLHVPNSGPDMVAARLRWLADLPAYSPHPYEQLASWYRKIGHDDEARRVLLAKQRRRRRTLGPYGRLWGRLLDATVGYGYRPWQAALWLAALTLLGTWVFHDGRPHPVQPGQGTPFSPFIYTLDLLIPIGGFGQRGAWYWTGLHQWFGYGLIAAGWLLTTTVLAGISRALNRT